MHPILINNEIQKVNPETVKIGSEIIVKPGEKIPLDGVIIKGNSNIDISNIKGESIPLYVKEDTEVLSGSINLTSLITVKTTKSFNDSTVSKILDLVENSESSKAKIESFITKFAKVYTPIVIVLTFLVAFLIPVITGDYDFKGWIHRGLIFLVISCPCALVISVPLCYFAGIGIASKYGILIKGGNYLEALSNVENVLFDKTGTLTVGNFNVEKIIVNKGYKNNLLEHAVYAEYFSNHPIGKVIVKYFKEKENNKVNIKTDLIDEYNELPGMGMKIELNGKIILAGNSKLMKKYNIDFKEVENIGIVVHIAYNGIYEGTLILGDTLKKDSKKVINKLHKNKIENVVMLTGDRESVAKETAKILKIDKVFFDLLPDEKMKILNEIKKDSRGTTVFIGDGTNDAPVLNSADIGISMGGLGTSAAIETSDIVFMTDEPSKLLTSINISEYTKNIAKQNIFIALFIKVIVMILGVMGLANMWEAVFADVGVTLIVLINSIRIIKRNYEMEV
jgi:Cd2+/Zn2+-exporting ATPase